MKNLLFALLFLPGCATHQYSSDRLAGERVQLVMLEHEGARKSLTIDVLRFDPPMIQGRGEHGVVWIDVRSVERLVVVGRPGRLSGLALGCLLSPGLSGVYANNRR